MPSFVALVVDRRLETISYSGRAKSDVEVDRWIAVRVIHVYLDNARYHHAKLVRDWLAQPERRIKRHFVPPHCPHLNPIEHLWGPVHRNLTHNRCYAAFNEFCDAMPGFLKEDVPRNWGDLCDDVSDNFRVISPKDFRGLT
jgi:hypothetical protein